MTGARETGLPSVARSMLYKERWVRSLSPEEALPLPYTTMAIRTASEVAEELGINPETMTVTLYVVCAPDAPGAARHNGWCNGYTPNGESVFISAELTAAQLVTTCAHEVRHVQQIRQGLPVFQSREVLERDAGRFGHEWAQRKLRSEWLKQRPGEPVPEVFR